MPKTLFSADHHNGHKNILWMSQRPFSSIEEMEEVCVERWNAVANTDDTIYYLGDFAYKMHPARLKVLRARLNGTIHFIPGNHDKKPTLKLPWASQKQIAFVEVEGVKLVLCHYALRTWPGRRRGVKHLYGHSHGRIPATSDSLDVGVDCWNFAPATLEQVLERMRISPAPTDTADGKLDLPEEDFPEADAEDEAGLKP